MKLVKQIHWMGQS